MGGRRIPPQLCTRCKGYKRLCGLPVCPILERFRSSTGAITRITPDLAVEGDTPPTVIVGEHGYPKVNIYYYIPPGIHGEEAAWHDNPQGWARARTPLHKIIRMRSYMLSATTRNPVDNPWTLYEKEVSLAAVSEKPVDTEARLRKPPTPTVRFDGILQPLGPRAPAEKLTISSNPSVNPVLDKLVNDDLKAEEAVYTYYRRTGDVYRAAAALSLGLLGRLKTRKLVPTRWAITAVDDMISRRLLSTIRNADTIDHIELYHAEYLGNIFTIILIPGAYEAEMLEAWHPLTPWTQNTTTITFYTVRENIAGRTSTIDGGFSAARLAILEHLAKRGRTAKAIIVREVTRNYYAPVGNWHIRETVRRALSSRPEKFATLEEALTRAKAIHKPRELITRLEKLTLTRKTRNEKTLDHYLITK